MHKASAVVSRVAVGLSAGFLGSAAAGQCEPEWLPGFSAVNGPLNGAVNAVRVWERAGFPSRLAVSSSFPVPNEPPVPLALWDGQAWQPLPRGPGIQARGIAVYNGDLVAAGFGNQAQGAMAFVARWDGVQWSSLGTGVNGPVRAIAVHGNDLYVGGEFNAAGGTTAQGIARWDGQQWHSAGSVVGMVLALHSADAAAGGGLVVGGMFASAGGVSVQNIARLDGGVWSAMGGRPGAVECIESFQGAIIAGGQAPSGQPTIARWDGQAWQPLGAGVNQTVRSLLVQGGALYAAGFFTTAGGQPASRIARWDGAAWSAMGAGLGNSFGAPYVNTLGSFRGEVIAGGLFDTAGGEASFNFARWGCEGELCYANCDASTAAPILNVADFTCFLQRYAAGESYANCDLSTTAPTLNVADFTCFLQKFAAGCP
jgi:hypothetical protein